MTQFSSINSVVTIAVFSAILIIILDILLGETAEFFNAYYFLLYLFDWIPGVPKLEHKFVLKQDEIGIFAPLLAITIYIIEIVVVSILIIVLLYILNYFIDF